MHQNPLQNAGRNSHHSQKTRANRDNRTQTRRHSARTFPVGGFASPALAGLPNLPPTLPTEYVIPSGVVEGAAVALDMLDAGVLTHTDKGFSPTMMVEQSMSKWFASLTHDLQFFAPDLFMTNDLGNVTLDMDEKGAKKHFGVESEKTLTFAVSFAAWHWFTLQERCEALEAKVPGLGETAIRWLDTHIHPLMTAVTPNFTLYAAQHVYWYGEDDESEAVEEILAMGEDPEDMDLYTKADFDASFPKMSYAAAEKLDRDALTSLLSHPDREVADLAALLLEETPEDGVGGSYLQQFCDDHMPVLEPAICIGWSAADDTVQIVDDYFNREAECGGTDLHAMWVVEQSAEGVLKGRQMVEKFIAEIKKIEKVLSFIAVIDKTRERED